MAGKSWEEIRGARVTADPGFEEGYERARVNFELAQLVYTLRARAGLTQTELARRIGTKQPHIARLEGGSVSPTIDLLRRLGEALGVGLVLRAEGVPRDDDAMEVRFTLVPPAVGPNRKVGEQKANEASVDSNQEAPTRA